MGFFNFFSSERTNTTQSTTNNVTDYRVGASEHGIALGAGSSGNSVSNVSNVTTINADADIAGAGLALAHDYLAQGGAVAGAGLALANNTAAAALAASRDIAGIASATSLDALHTSLNAVASASHDSASVAVAALDSNNKTTNTALNFAGGVAMSQERIAGAAIAGNLDALHQSLQAVTNSQAISDSLLQTSIGQFTGALESTTQTALQVAANAAPQTDKALLERLAANQGVTGPATGGDTNKKNFDWPTIATVGLIVAVAYYFIKTAK